MTTIERILNLMTESGITARKLTTETGLNHSSVTEWKKGKANPSYGAIVKIAKYFDVSEDYLLGKSPDPRPAAYKQSPSDEPPDSEIVEQVKKILTQLSEDVQKDVLEYAEYVKSKHNQEAPKAPRG